MVLCSLEKRVDDKPLCSVCIANYNGESYLEKCIDSIIDQKDFSGGIEIIVHDDASVDGSVELLHSKYPHVCLLTSTENVGFCVSNNRMVDVARGTFVLLLNNDAVLHKSALKALYDASQKYGDGIYGLPQYDANSGKLIDIGSTFDPFLNPIPNKDKYRQDVGMIIGANLWLPKTLWNKIGGFPEWFGSLAEDMYVCCVARLWGYPVMALSESGFDHWVGKSLGGGKVTKENTLSTTKLRRALSERNKSFVMFICYPLLLLIVLFPAHILLLCGEGMALTIMKRSLGLWTEIYWNCLREIVKQRKMLFSARSHVQSKKKISLPLFFAPFSWVPHKVTMFIRHGVPEVK